MKKTSPVMRVGREERERERERERELNIYVIL
jgi:hypothetical protein